MNATWRTLNTSLKGCGRYSHLDPIVPAAHGRGYGYTDSGVGFDNRVDKPEDSMGCGSVAEDGEGFSGLPAFVSNVSAGETDAIVQRLTP